MSEDNEDYSELEKELEAVDIQETPETVSEEHKTERSPKTVKHMSKDEWVTAGKDPNLWKDEKKFEEDGNWIAQITEERKARKKLEEDNRKTQELLKKTLEYNNRVREKEIAERLAAAKQTYNMDALESATQEKVAFQQERMQQIKVAQEEVEGDFWARNPWIAEDPLLVQKATHMAATLQQAYQGTRSYEDLAKMVEERMKTEHPEARSRPTQVPRMSAPGASDHVVAPANNDSRELAKLSADDKAFYRDWKAAMAKVGVQVTPKSYIAKLKRDGLI